MARPLLGFRLLPRLKRIGAARLYRPGLPSDADWAEIDRRALTPLFWTHVNPYGKFTLDIDSELDLDPPVAAATPACLPPATPTRAPGLLV